MAATKELLASVGAQVRGVTDDEVDFYYENGWVKLEGLIAPALAAELVSASREILTGEGSESRVRVRPERHDYYYRARDEQDEPFYSLVYAKELGRNVQRLFGREVGVRYGSDIIYCKAPAGREGSKPTVWHQDWVGQPHDRAGNLSVWIALDDMPPERGVMRFVTGSHREGPLGYPTTFDEETEEINRREAAPVSPLGRGQPRVRLASDVLAYYPHLLERHELSPPLSMKAGDATVHNGLTVHGAPENTTDEWRWTYIVAYFPADVRYTGLPQYNYDDLGLERGQPIDHPRFAVVYP